jgi:hypothetical protein
LRIISLPDNIHTSQAIETDDETQTEIETMSRKENAVAELIERGAENIKKEDRFGDTRSGWWMDQTFLGKDPVVALEVLLG